MKSNKFFMLAASFLMLASTVGCSGNYTESSEYPNPQCLYASNQDVVRDEASGKIVHSTSGACVRTNWLVDHNPCGDLASTAGLTVYFDFNKTSLTPESIAQIDALVASLKGQKNVKGIHIVGYADRIGKSAHNSALSKARAENVRQYLIAKGLVQAKVAKTKWVGSDKASAKCASDLSHAELVSCLKTDRRVEIVVDYAPDVHTGK